MRGILRAGKGREGKMEERKKLRLTKGGRRGKEREQTGRTQRARLREGVTKASRVRPDAGQQEVIAIIRLIMMLFEVMDDVLR